MKGVQERPTKVRDAWFSPLGAGTGNLHRCFHRDRARTKDGRARMGNGAQSNRRVLRYFKFSLQYLHVFHCPKSDSFSTAGEMLQRNYRCTWYLCVALTALSYFRPLPTCNSCALAASLSGEVLARSGHRLPWPTRSAG